MLPLPALLACPPVQPAPVVEVEVVVAGHLSNDWKLVVDDGTEGPVDMPLLVGVLHHPDGVVLVDSGMGLTTRAGEYPGWPLSTFELTVPEGEAIVERLAEPPALVLMTHLHYDHVGGLLDLAPTTPVWVWETEWRTFGAGGQPGFPLKRFKKAVDWQVKSLQGGSTAQVLGRPALDVMGDGSIWYLNTPGHTPGAASVLVFGTEGPVLFVGDTAWVDKHLHGARRPKAVTALVDAYPRQLRESLEWARWLEAECPELTVVSGHEPRWAQ